MNTESKIFYDSKSSAGHFTKPINVLLIAPLNISFSTFLKNCEIDDAERKNESMQIIFPSGLLSIAAYTTQCNRTANIKILDFNILLEAYASNSKNISREAFWRFCLSEINGFVPDIIGISASFCSNLKDLNPLADILRQQFHKCIIVCGGHMASACYEQIFEDGKSINAICFGEGEIPFLELTNSMNASIDDAKLFLENNDSWLTRDKIRNNKNFVPVNDLIYNLDEIPRYDLDIIVKKNEYARYRDGMFAQATVREREQFFMMTTRGCIAKCVFCASQNVHGHKVRTHSISRVKQDILYYREKYNVDHFIFIDDNFLFNKKFAIEILEFMIKNKFSISIENLAFFYIDETIAKLLKKAGISTATLAIENGNEETLKNIIHKPTNLDRAKKAIKCLKDEGIIVISNFLIGLPGETKSSIEKSIQGMIDLRCNWSTVHVATPLPGSELFDICKRNNYFAEDTDIYQMDFKKCVICTPDFDPQYIESKAYEINLYVNFVKNSDMRAGNYEAALEMFERVLNLVISKHALAYYFAAVCAKNLNLQEKYLLYKARYEEMIQKYSFWAKWADFFKLETL